MNALDRQLLEARDRTAPLGDHLAYRRRQLGLTAKEVGSRVKLSDQAILFAERDQLPFETQVRIAKALRIPKSILKAAAEHQIKLFAERIRSLAA